MLQPCNVWSEDKYTIEGYKAGVADLQTALKTKFHNGCKLCKNEEAQKIRSRRQATNEFAEDNQLSMTKLNDKNEDRVDDLKKYILALDNIRDTDYTGTFSEWWDILIEKTPN